MRTLLCPAPSWCQRVWSHPPLYPLRFDVVEALTGFTRNKRYKLRVWDPARGAEVPKEGVTSGDIMKLKEDSDCCCRIFLGPARAFRMSLYPYAEVRENVAGDALRVNQGRSTHHRSCSPSAQGQYPPPGADIFTLPGSVTLERPFRCGRGGEGRGQWGWEGESAAGVCSGGIKVSLRAAPPLLALFSLPTHTNCLIRLVLRAPPRPLLVSIW